MSQKDSIEYPPGVRDLTENISTDDLVRRLKECAQAFQNMSQEEDNSAYIPLALHLASETFLDHNSPDVRLLVACCIADVFRVYAPEAPYKDVNKLTEIFEFFVEQLKGLKNPQHPSFKRYFYLLENLSCVKTFNICFEFEENQKIINTLFELMFKIVCEQHNNKVRNFMLDMLCPLITEADQVPQDLLDIIFTQIVEPFKSMNKVASILAEDIIKRTSSTLEPYIQNFFNRGLILGSTPKSPHTKQFFELAYELNAIAPSMMVVVLPQLEFKLKSGDEKERMQVTKAVIRMFVDNKTMMEQNKSLWASLMQRFNDICPAIRLLCVQHCKLFLLKAPERKEDITEQLCRRAHDQEEEIRLHAIKAVVEVAEEDLDCVTRSLLDCVKDRTLDKKFPIRKEAITGLAKVYKKYVGTPLATSLESISWIKNKVLHMYYQTSMEDKLLVERILHTCFIPYQSPMEERMKMLYQLFCSLDENAVKAFKEILRCQKVLRGQVKMLLENIHKDKNEVRLKIINSKVTTICKSLNDPVKSRQFIVQFGRDLEKNSRLSKMLSILLHRNITCSEAESKVKEILKIIGSSKQNTLYYGVVKQLLERIAPVMIDRNSVKYIVLCVKDSLIDGCGIELELGLENSATKGLDLLLLISYTFPQTFQCPDIYNNLMLFLQTEYEFASDKTLQILINVVNDLERNYPHVSSKLIPLLQNFAETGSSKQAKHAVYCINNIISNKTVTFGNLIDNLKKHLTLTSQYFRTALVSIGHIAFLNSNMFATDLKAIITKIIHDLLMLDQDFPRGGENMWGDFDDLPDETKCKIEGMKVMIRWLIGLKDFIAPATSTLCLFTNILMKDGELGDRTRVNNMAPMEKSWMRSSASSCILKLCHEPSYAPLVTLETFLVLSNVMNDECADVAERFAKKLHKGLFYLKIPLEYMAMLPLAGLSNRKTFVDTIKGNLRANIQKRRSFVREQNVPNEKLPMILPDYSLSYTVYLLAHSDVLKTYDDIEGLKKVKECLRILLDALMAKNDSYSFPFFKRLLENIKQTKDKKSLPEAGDTEEITKIKQEMNFKMYAVCDLGLNIILSKPNHVLNEFPAEPSLNTMFFTNPDKSYSNMKTYLPPELLDKMRAGFEIEMFNSSKTINSTANEQTTVNSTNHLAESSTSHADMDVEDTLDEEASTSSVAQSSGEHKSSRSKRPLTETNGTESGASSKKCHMDNTASEDSEEMEMDHFDSEASILENTIISNDPGDSSSSENKRSRGRPKGKTTLNNTASENSEEVEHAETSNASKDSPNSSSSVNKRSRGRPKNQPTLNNTASENSEEMEVEHAETSIPQTSNTSKDTGDNLPSINKRSRGRPKAKTTLNNTASETSEEIEVEHAQISNNSKDSDDSSVNKPSRGRPKGKITLINAASVETEMDLADTHDTSKDTSDGSVNKRSRGRPKGKTTLNNTASEDSEETEVGHAETSNTSKDSGDSSPNKRSRGRPKGKATPKKMPPPPSPRLSRSASVSTPEKTSRKNGPSASPSEASSCTSNYDHLIRECNVCLSKDEVESYETKSRGSSGSEMAEAENKKEADVTSGSSTEKDKSKEEKSVASGSSDIVLTETDKGIEGKSVASSSAVAEVVESSEVSKRGRRGRKAAKDLSVDESAEEHRGKKKQKAKARDLSVEETVETMDADISETQKDRKRGNRVARKLSIDKTAEAMEEENNVVSKEEKEIAESVEETVEDSSIGKSPEISMDNSSVSSLDTKIATSTKRSTRSKKNSEGEKEEVEKKPSKRVAKGLSVEETADNSSKDISAAEVPTDNSPVSSSDSKRLAPAKKVTRSLRQSGEKHQLLSPISTTSETTEVDNSPVSSVDSKNVATEKKSTRSLKNNKGEKPMSSPVSNKSETAETENSSVSVISKKSTRSLRNSKGEKPPTSHISNNSETVEMDSSSVSSLDSKLVSAPKRNTRTLRNSESSSVGETEEKAEVESNVANKKGKRVAKVLSVDLTAEITDNSSVSSVDGKSATAKKRSARSLRNSEEEKTPSSSVSATKSEATEKDNSSLSSLDTKSAASSKIAKKPLKNTEAEKPVIPLASAKRKREISVPIRFVQNSVSSLSASSSSPGTPTKSPVKNGNPGRATRAVHKSKLLPNNSAKKGEMAEKDDSSVSSLDTKSVASSIRAKRPLKNSEAEKPVISLATTKKSKDSKTQPKVNNSRSQQTNTRQKKNTEVKVTGKRR